MSLSTKLDLERQVEDLTERLATAEAVLHALRNQEVDALVMSGPQGDQVFTLQGAESAYRLLVEAMNEGALTVAIDGTVLYCNERFAEMVECGMEKVVGSNWRHFFPSDEQPLVQALLSESKNHGTKAEFTLQTVGGSTLPVQISARMVQMNGVEAVGVLVTDVTEVKSAQEDLRRMNEELEARVKERTQELAGAKEKLARHAKDLELRVQERTAQLQEIVEDLESFSYSVSHDLRAPLRSIQSFAQILDEECTESLSEEHRGYLRRVVNSAARLDKLILDVLAYSRMSRAELILEPVAFDRLVRDVLKQYPALQSPDVQVVIADGWPPVMGHEASLAQCASNLLSNAVKFVAPGTKPQVSIRAESLANETRIWFEDNGIGIAPDDRERIFRIFERGAGVSDYTGTGIGLSIVRRAIEKMGGTVGVESEPGRGSRFWIQLQTAA